MSLSNPASVIILLLLVVVFNSSCGTLTNLSVCSCTIDVNSPATFSWVNTMQVSVKCCVYL